MPRNESEGLRRVHIWLYAEDIDRIHRLYDRSAGFSKAIRTIVHKFLNEIEAKAQVKAKAIPMVELVDDL